MRIYDGTDCLTAVCPLKAHSSLSEDEGKPPSQPPVSSIFLSHPKSLGECQHSTGPPVTAHGKTRVLEHSMYCCFCCRRCVDYFACTAIYRPWSPKKTGRMIYFWESCANG